jgi:hypothetical protein
LLAVAKLSRPVYKDDERDLTVRVRLDFWFMIWQFKELQKISSKRSL